MNAQLQQFVNRIERLETEKKTITTDISEVYKEAKLSGFDPKIMRKLIAKRKKPAAERQEEESLLDVYEVALGGVDNGPVTFTRKDGVKVTMERAGAEKPTVATLTDIVMAEITREGAKTFSVDLNTGEITNDIPQAADCAAVEKAAGEGATSPAATLSDVGEVTPQLVASEAVEVPPVETASTADLSESLAIPDFMVRSKPPMHPAAQAEAFRA